MALAAPPGDFIEIGTAHGAATVALALALKEGGQQGRVHTFGKPGIGAQVASADELRERFQRFGLEDVVTVHIAEAAAAPKLLQEPTIALLMLDADGRIDRDFCNLFARGAGFAPDGEENWPRR